MITNHRHFSCVSAVPIWLRAHVRLGVLLLHNTGNETSGDGGLYAAAFQKLYWGLQLAVLFVRGRSGSSRHAC